ncbi:MAG: alpha/beta fold hydrolase [Deltaproteobacteria bacterium]
MRYFAVVGSLLVACGGSTPDVDVKPASGGDAFADGDVVTYVLQDGAGRTLGRAHGRVSRGDGRLELVTRVAYGDPAAATVEYATTTREDGSLLAYKRLSSVEGRLQVAARDGFLSIITDIAQRKVPYDTASRALMLGRDDLLAIAAAIRQSGLEPGQSGKIATWIPSTGEPEAVPVQVFADASRNTVAQLPGGKATFDARGYVKTFERADGSKYVLEAKPSDPPRLLPVPQPASYERPRSATWEDREVLVDVEQGRYAGVLSVPTLRARWSNGLAPGVVVLGDLPATNRHGFGHTVDYGRWELFDHLAEEGFAVLRLDDRGVGTSRTDIEPSKVTVQQRAADAEAMLDFLKRQKGVDPEKLFVIGHGFGAIEAILVAQRVELAGLVLVSTPYRAVPEVLAEREMKLHDTKPDEAVRRMNVLLSLFSGSAAAETQVPQRIVALYREAQGRVMSASKLNVDGELAKVEEPIAVFQGLKDFETSWKDDAQAMEKAINKRKRRQAKLFVFADVDHLMKSTPGPSTLEAYADRGRRWSPEVLKDLVGWLTERAK